MPVTLHTIGRATFALSLMTILTTSCSQEAGLEYEHPPAGVPDTPYWYTIGDSLFWYLPSDSSGMLQMSAESTPDERSQTLMAVRKLGWRMAVQRTGMTRSTEAQDLSQDHFAMDRVDLAPTMIDNYGAFRESFWSGPDTTLLALLPALRLQGSGPPQYYWPSAFVVVWKPGTRETEMRAKVDSLGLEVYMPLAMAQNYWVDRSWTIFLSAGVDVFTWLRWFNREPHVHVAYPLLSTRDEPYPDQRIPRRFAIKPDSLIPPGVEKCSPSLRMAWEIATFCGHTDFIEDNTSVAASEGRMRVMFRWSGDSDPVAQIKEAGGEVLSATHKSIEAWVPYDKLPALAASPAVTSAEEVRANILGD